jgi:hypothetical protein
MKMKSSTAITAFSAIAALSASPLAAAPFGNPEDIEFAEMLWSRMNEAGFIGANGIMSVPYTGQHPHGAILDTIEGPIDVNDQTSHLIVKRNYGGEGVSKQAVADDPDMFLMAVTVMIKRDGYDPDNADWFWAKYLADGSLDKNPAGVPLAGRVAKGMEEGCIACHKSAPGGDYIFNHD